MQIKADAYIEKASKLGEGEVEFVVSTGAVDAHGERINVDGINYKEYMKNPVVLWGHDGYSLPIAKATKVWKSDGKLMARATFYLKDEFAAKVYNFIVDGFLNAVSIGGMVEDWGSDGMTIAKLKMKEFSVVSIPANPEALVAAKSLDTDKQKELDKLFITAVQKRLANNTSLDELIQQIETLENLTATLKEVATGKTQGESADEPQTLRVVLRQAQVVDQQVERVIRHIKLKGNSNNE